MRSLPTFVSPAFLLTLVIASARAATPAVTSLPASGVGTDQASLSGSVNPNGDATLAWFEWGATPNYGSVTTLQAMGSDSVSTNFSQVVTGLTPSSTYHFRAMASNSFGVATGANQSFTTPVFSEIGAGLTGLWKGSVEWGDYDNDGRLDLLIVGQTDLGTICQVWRNTGAGFSNVNAGLPGAFSATWCDYDNDSRLDILISGWQMWRNTGNGFALTNVGLSSIVPVNLASVAFGDYDNDGRVDVARTWLSYDLSAYVTDLWKNTGGIFVTNKPVFPPASSATWGDFDNDGRLDLLLAASGGNGMSQVWRNTGEGFTNINAGLTPLRNGAAIWGDYDNDGRLDIALVGESGFQGPVAQIWRNTGSGFVDINAGIQPVFGYASVAWGDYDNDGRLDLLFADGYDSSSLRLWRNTVSGFVRIETGVPTGIRRFALGDYDNDGRLDLAVVGTDGCCVDPLIAQVWRNRLPQTNTPPTSPNGLSVVATGNAATFAWNAGSDAQTPAAGLTYNLRVGTAPGGSDVVSPMSLSNGVRTIPQFGNRQLVRRCVVNVPLDQTLYWSVQTVDSALAGSAFAPESSFRLNSSFISTNYSFLGDLNRDGVVDAAEFNIVLSNYFRLNSPAIDSVSQPTTNVFQFGLSNLMNLGFTVLATTNVALPLTEWEPVGSAALLYQFTDPNATNHPTRFYKLRWP